MSCPDVVSAGAFVGAGSLMTTQPYSDQQVPLNSKTHNSLMHLNPPNSIRVICVLLSQTEFANSIRNVPPIGLIVLLRHLQKFRKEPQVPPFSKGGLGGI